MVICKVCREKFPAASEEFCELYHRLYCRTGRVITWGAKISRVKKGKPFALAGWNRGLTKETSESMAKIANNQERNEKIRQAMLGRDYPESWKEKDRIAKLEAHKDSEYTRRMMASLNIKPNKPEIKLMEILDRNFPQQWKYVGNGELIIAGKNPDFVNINGKKQLIELFGRYWHSRDNSQDRINFFRTFGFSTIVIWDDELCDERQLVDKVINFPSVETLHELSADADKDKVQST